MNRFCPKFGLAQVTGFRKKGDYAIFGMIPTPSIGRLCSRAMPLLMNELGIPTMDQQFEN